MAIFLSLIRTKVFQGTQVLNSEAGRHNQCHGQGDRQGHVNTDRPTDDGEVIHLRKCVTAEGTYLDPHSLHRDYCHEYFGWQEYQQGQWLTVSSHYSHCPADWRGFAVLLPLPTHHAPRQTQQEKRQL